MLIASSTTMQGFKFSLVFIFTFCLGIGDCSPEAELWDRFRLWFHSMDHNLDDILSAADTETCNERHSENVNLDQETVRTKCEEFLPRWYHYFPLRQRKSITETDFIEAFQNLRNQSVEKFVDVVFNAGKTFWVIIDMNNDGVITHNEDNCVKEGTSLDARVLADNFILYLLVGREAEDIDDLACPWI